MKTIFWEQSCLATIEQAQARRANYYSDRIYVERMTAQITVQTQAHYDAKRSVLVVDHTLQSGRLLLELPTQPPARTLETIGSEAAAIRRAVALADAWHAAVRAALPVSTDSIPDAPLIASAQARGAVLDPIDD